MTSPINTKILFLCFICVINLRQNEAIDCWLGAYGGSSTGTLATQTTCSSPANADTCKAVIEYSNGFQNFPVTTLSCVNANADVASNNQGCSACTVTQLSTVNGCILTSYDGIYKTFCSQATNGNRQLVTSCYVGTFSPIHYINTATPTACASYSDFCEISFTGIYPIGSCSVTCSGGLTKCCNSNNCNIPLSCYVGTYNSYKKGSSNFVQTVCSTQTAKFCKSIYGFDPINGLTVVGSCENTCTTSPVVLANQQARGTLCCTSHYCNIFGFETSLKSSSASKIFSLFRMLLFSTISIFNL